MYSMYTLVQKSFIILLYITYCVQDEAGKKDHFQLHLIDESKNKSELEK